MSLVSRLRNSALGKQRFLADLVEAASWWVGSKTRQGAATVIWRKGNEGLSWDRVEGQTAVTWKRWD